MQIFKFGGASISTKERIENLPAILRHFPDEKIVVVISAMGKTTNALEQVVDTFWTGNKDEAIRKFNEISEQHVQLAKTLLKSSRDNCLRQLKDFFTEAEWLLHDKPVRGYDYYYDQMVCIGELMSTTILSFYLNEQSVSNVWVDVRDIIRTDDNFRDANIDWEKTTSQMEEKLLPLFDQTNIIVVQGFIGATDENESTTLGREGSDFTAAIFANILNAKAQTIWKDVAAVMNADPKEFPEAKPIAELNYTEVIEMAYYGAQVIHPKTIKPLQNKGIPLFVKCFLDPKLPGTVIHKASLKNLPPIIVIKKNQLMLELNSKDFSFVGEKPVGQLYHWFEELSIKPNLAQTGAISIVCVMDDREEKIDKLAHAASEIFNVQIRRGLTLLTIRHYNNELFEKMTKDRTVLLKQQTPETVQVLLGNL